MNRTDALQQALASVYSGADILDAMAVADHLGDLGFRVTQKAVKRMKPRGVTAPMASTTGVTKRRTSG